MLALAGKIVAPMLLVALAAPAQQAVRLELVTTIRAEGGTIHAAAFSPDGAWLATGGEIGEVRVIDVASQQVRWTTQPSNSEIGELVFSPDGTRLACHGTQLTIHDAATGAEQLRIERGYSPAFAWLDEGTRFVHALHVDLVLHDGKQAKVCASFKSPIDAIAVGDDGATWFVGDRTGRLWRVPAEGGVPVLHREPRTNKRSWWMALSAAGGVLFDLGQEGPLHRGQVTLEVPSTPYAFAVARDGRSFAVGGASLAPSAALATRSSTVRWWSDAGAEHEDLVVGDSVAALALQPDGKRLFVSTYAGQSALHERGREPVPMPGCASNLQGITLTPDGTALAVQGREWVLHPLDGRPARNLAHTHAVHAGRLGPQLLLERPGQLVVLDTQSGNELRSVPIGPGHRGPVGLWPGHNRQVGLGPGELLLVDGVLVDNAGTPVVQLREDVKFFSGWSCALASDGRWAIGGSWGIHGEVGCLLLTDPTGKHERFVADGPARCVSFSPDAKLLSYVRPAGIFADGFLVVHDTETLAVRKEVSPIGQWKFLDDKRALVFSRRKLQIWDVGTFEPIETLPVEGTGFQLSDDRRTLVVPHRGAVQVYRVSFD